ncbi:MAG: DUF2207 domain-containing protein, partial [Mycobacterium sp.]|nr:DUF2207 domain-containing protein [Mycobacterium sp.]
MWPAMFSGPSGGAQVDDPVVITTLRAQFDVDADGLMQATETITGEFPYGRHGIFRYWDISNANSFRARQVPDITEISLDGRPVPFQLSWENDRFRVAKIGDPDSYLTPGSHTYRIRYSVPGVLDRGMTGADRKFASAIGDPGSAPSVFFWNVIAPAWNNRIERAEVAVTLPGPVPGVKCSVGAGVGLPCEELAVTGQTVRLAATGLPPRTPVTVRADIDVPTPARTGVPWPVAFDGVLGRSVPVVVWLLGLTVAAGLGAFLWWRSTVEPPPGFPLQYAPPSGLSPVQCEYIRT